MYVSNLGFHINDEDLRKLFETFGTVSSATIITDRETGKSRGFGFVEMGSQPEADGAMNGLNGKEIEGRFINVTAAREKEYRSDKKKW